MSGLGVYTMFGPNDASRATMRRMTPDAMLLMGRDALRWAAELPSVYTIYRSYALVPDGLVLSDTPDECFAQGVEVGMALAYEIAGTGVKACMALNERQPGNQYDAARIGAFEAGVASVVAPRGFDFVAFNWSVGYRYADRVAVAWAELRRRCLAAGVDMRRVILGVHGYTATAQDRDAPWYENRAHIFYQAEFNIQGIPWPEWALTEAGFDNGIQNANGWRHNLTEADYAAYLRRLPGLTPQAKFRTLFAWRCTDDWKQNGFEIEDATLVEQAIAETNLLCGNIPNGNIPPNQGGTPMITKNLGTMTLFFDAESAPFDAWIAAAGGAEKVVYDSFRLWYAATQGDVVPTRADLVAALSKIGSGSDEAKLIANKLPFV